MAPDRQLHTQVRSLLLGEVVFHADAVHQEHLDVSPLVEEGRVSVALVDVQVANGGERSRRQQCRRRCRTLRRGQVTCVVSPSLSSSSLATRNAKSACLIVHGQYHGSSQRFEQEQCMARPRSSVPTWHRTTIWRVHPIVPRLQVRGKCGSLSWTTSTVAMTSALRLACRLASRASSLKMVLGIVFSMEMEIHGERAVSRSDGE